MEDTIEQLWAYRMNIPSPSSADMEYMSYCLVHCLVIACHQSLIACLCLRTNAYVQ